MRAHQIDESGLILNTIEVEDLTIFPNLHDASIGGVIGDSIIEGELVPAAPPEITAEEHNAPILAALEAIDAKSIRPLREGDIARVAVLEQQAAALRLQLRKD